MKPTAALSLVIILLVIGLVSCGGTVSSALQPPSTSTPPTSGGTSSTTTAPAAPGKVTVTAGQTASGIDIAVVPPQASTAPNAQDLGVADMSGSGSAYNTGDVIHRGQTVRVLLFGPGLDSSMVVTIGGPPGIAVSGITSIKSTDNTPGISFVATVAGDAALGARSVRMQNTAGDITTFTGGLEVVP